MNIYDRLAKVDHDIVVSRVKAEVLRIESLESCLFKWQSLVMPL